MNINSFLWLLPFCSFISGYFFMQQFFRASTISTPHVIGKYVHEALPLFSQHQLNLRLIEQKEDNTLPEGIIINQVPKPGTIVKPHQSLFVVTTKKPATKQLPLCTGKHKNLVLTELQKIDIHPKIYTMPHSYPADVCFAQYPEKDRTIEDNKCILYISEGNNKPIIWPSFSGKSLQEITYFLERYGIKPYLIHNDSINELSDSYTIIDQRPLAGTLITIDQKNPLSVQLRIQ